MFAPGTQIHLNIEKRVADFGGWAVKQCIHISQLIQKNVIVIGGRV